MKLLNIVIASLLPACMVPASSSRAVLPPDESHLVVAEPPLDAARDVTRLFAARSFAMVDSQPLPDGSIGMVFKGSRGAVTTGDKHSVDTYAIGSVFHVHIVPAAEGADIRIVGNPSVSGDEKCNDNGTDCGSVPRSIANDTEIEGRSEAEVVHGVFSELTLEGRGPVARAVQ